MRAICPRLDRGVELAVNELKTHDREPARYQIAEVYAFRGELDRAFGWLETAYQMQDFGTALVRCDPLLKNLHGDPRCLLFLRTMNLADDQLT